MRRRGLYKLLIVDDEKSIRDGLSEVVDWPSLGYSLAGVYSDGREVLRFLETQTADVILSDIRMPHVDGLALAKHIWENQLAIKVVLLTGYKHFEYAQSACEYGVSYYLLKPTELPVLQETFQKLKQQLDREWESRENIRLLQQSQKEQLFADIYFGGLPDSAALDGRLMRMGLTEEFQNATFTVVHMHIENYDHISRRGYGREQIYKALHHFWEMKYPALRFAVPYQEEDDVAYIVYGASALPADAQEAAADEMREVMGLSVRITLEGPYHGVYEMDRERKKQPQRELIDLKQLIEQQKLLFSYLFSNQDEQAEALLNAMLRSLKDVGDETAHSFMLNLFGLLLKRLDDLGIACDERMFTLPKVAEGREALWAHCRKSLAEICALMGRYSTGTENLAINRAKDFIRENYDRDILLEDVANHVFLSPAYLSRIFKKHVGENFSNYLFNLRMNKAKALLKNSNLKVYEISERVGIQTPKYFFKLFKDHTGLTPSEYRAGASCGEEDEK